MNTQTFTFEQAIPVWPLGREAEMNLWLSFRTVVKGAEKTVLRLTGSSAYDVRINGEFFAFGPARCAHGFYRVDELDLSGKLHENDIITINVAGYNADSYYHLDQPSFLCAELAEDGKITAATGMDGFLCRVMTEHEQKAQRFSGQRTFVEVYDLDASIAVWEKAKEIDPRDFAILRATPTENKVFIHRGCGYHTYEKITAEAIISRLDFTLGDYAKRVRYPNYIVARGEDTGPSKKDFSLGEVQTNLFAEARSIDVRNIHTTNEPPKTETITEKSGVTYKMPCNTTGKIAFDVVCDEDTEIVITFDEILGDDGLVNYRRMYTVNTAMWRLKSGAYHISTFEPYTLGYLHIFVKKGRAFVGDVHIKYFGADRVEKRYTGENKALCAIFDAAVETYRQNTFTIYMDCPSRERAGWLCDSFFTARVEKALTGKSEVERVFLENFFLPDSFKALPKGMFPMCYPADHENGNFIPNWAMWLVLELHEYLQRTGDRAFIDSAKKRIYALCDYFKGFQNKDGLLEKLERWVFVEWSECNKLTQDINYPTNMLYAKMLETVDALYGDEEMASKAKTIKDVIRRESMTESGFYCDNAVYGEDGVARLSGKCTETCQYYAFFCGITNPEENPTLWNILLNDFGPERIVPGKWPEFTPDAKYQEIYPSNAFIGNYLRLELLYRFGAHEKLIGNIKGYFTKMAALTGTLWENESTTASCDHGFASHVIYWMDGLGMIE